MSCELSDRGRAFSTVLSAFAGMIITGITNGGTVAFLTAWICWFSAGRNTFVSFKGLIVSVLGGAFGIKEPFLRPAHNALPTEEPKHDFELASSNTPGIFSQAHQYQSFGSAEEAKPLTSPQATYQSVHPDENEHISTAYLGGGVADYGYASHPSQTYSSVPSTDPVHNTGHAQRKRRANGGNMFRPGAPNRKPFEFAQKFTQRDYEAVTILGWIGWVYAFMYVPVNNVLWTVANWEKASNVLHFSRAVTVGVSALSYTIDTQARYGVALGRKVGNEKYIPRLFSIFTATSNCILSVNILVLLIRTATQTNHQDSDSDSLDVQDPLQPKGLGVPIPILVVFPIFSLIWAWASFKLLKTEDAGWKQTWKGRLFGLAMGIFGGAFVAAPAFAAMQSGFAALNDSSSPAAQLGEYLQCSSVSWWEKAVQILP